MFELALVLVTVAVILLYLSFTPLAKSGRLVLKIQDFGAVSGVQMNKAVKKKSPAFIQALAVVNKPLITPDIRRRLIRDLSLARLESTPEEFMLMKEMTIVALLVLVPMNLPADMMLFGILMSVACGYYLPEFWLRGKINRTKEEVVRYLPDVVDLLGLCVNAGLDFMMSLKWVVEKSSPNAVVMEMNNLLQEISVGKARRDALRDLSLKYQLPDLATFSRTLIQADKMGTSVTEALNILSEDMRLARFRRGEAMAMKAPIKLLVPLLFCIFPVVFILVGAPILLDFMTNNPMQKMSM